MNRPRRTNQVRAAREANGLTQGELAEAIGAGRVTIIRIEQGKQTPDVDRALELAMVLETTVEELFGDPDEYREQRVEPDTAEPADDDDPTAGHGDVTVTLTRQDGVQDKQQRGQFIRTLRRDLDEWDYYYGLANREDVKIVGDPTDPAIVRVTWPSRCHCGGIDEWVQAMLFNAATWRHVERHGRYTMTRANTVANTVANTAPNQAEPVPD